MVERRQCLHHHARLVEDAVVGELVGAAGGGQPVAETGGGLGRVGAGAGEEVDQTVGDHRSRRGARPRLVTVRRVVGLRSRAPEGAEGDDAGERQQPPHLSVAWSIALQALRFLRKASRPVASLPE